MQHLRYSWSATWLLLSAALPGHVAAQDGQGLFARIAILRPHEGETVDFEAGYIRHLAWHQQAGDRWVWYGWSVTYGERQRWFVYATFGHQAADFDNPVAPADDERDNVLNVVPHAEFAGNAMYRYLPEFSRGSGVPTPTGRMELTIVDLQAGAGKSFEAALKAGQGALAEETLWYRLLAGGPVPRYIRLRPRPSLAATLDRAEDQPLPEGVNRLVSRTTVEILTLRPTMSLGLGPH
jgi:hypothetical protein